MRLPLIMCGKQRSRHRIVKDLDPMTRLTYRCTRHMTLCSLKGKWMWFADPPLQVRESGGLLHSSSTLQCVLNLSAYRLLGSSLFLHQSLQASSTTYFNRSSQGNNNRNISDKAANKENKKMRQAGKPRPAKRDIGARASTGKRETGLIRKCQKG